MDKLEQYLDQVCRRIGGPRALRQHVRQELREHLLDAIAEHRASGLSQDEAVTQSLADFGGPEQVRSELEATHGQRWMATVIDKAMHWKEITMKAKWFWSTWAHLSLVLLVVLEALFITFLVIFIVPKFQKLLQDGLIDPAICNEQGVAWMLGFINGVKDIAGGYATWILLGALAVWLLFEWRVRSDHKTMIRLSALASAAVGLLSVIIVMTGSLVITFTLGAPGTARMARPFAVQQVTNIQTSITALTQSKSKNDWEAMQAHAKHALLAVRELADTGPAIPALAQHSAPPATVQEAHSRVAEVGALRTQVHLLMDQLQDIQQAILDKNDARLETALQNVHRTFGPILESATKPGR